jgi:hypothetical protein
MTQMSLRFPDLSVLEGVICFQFQKLSAGASSWFDAIPISFIKHACLPVRCDGKFKLVNVLAPLMARLFRVLLSESRVPACWKVAKLSPIHKTGEVLNPGNYRMIAVSGVIYRIFANVLKELVTDWCVKKGKIPDTQFGFFSGRSTLHPLFILRHRRHAAKKLKPRNSPRLHVAFIDFSQAYDTVPRQQLWSHLRRSAMPSTLLSVSSICMRMMSTFLYMVRRGLGCIPQMVSNRGAPSFSLCTSMTWAEGSVRALRVP